MSTTLAPRKSLARIRDETAYYEHQTSGIRTMARMTSFLLADEMGLGKSLQALTVAAIDYEIGAASRTLVVCPATLKGNWAEEIEKHTLFSYLVLDGDPTKRREQLETFTKENVDVLIVNYEQVKAHLDELNNLRFDIAVFDEAHYMKSPKAQRSKACLDLRVNRAFVLTGSPLLNHVDDLWALLHRINPVEYPNYWTFLHRFAVYGGFKDKQIVGIKNQAELTERLERVMIRRYKKDVLDLPEKQIVQVYVDLCPEQRKMYDQAAEELTIDLPGDPDPMQIENAMVRFLRLKQICGTTATMKGHPDKSSKLDQVVADAVELVSNGNPVVIFTQFREVLACLVGRLEKAGVAAPSLHGDVPQKDRMRVVQSWVNASEPQALVAMLQVAGVGLNMTAARHALFADELFVPKLNEQAEDRLHRIGADLTQPVQIRKYICRDTIESRIQQILRRKSKFFGEIVDQTAWKRALIQSLKQEGV